MSSGVIKTITYEFGGLIMKRINMSLLALLLVAGAYTHAMENNQEFTVTQNNNRSYKNARILGSMLVSGVSVIGGLLLGAGAGNVICNGNETCQSLMCILGTLAGTGGGIWLGEKIDPVNSRKHESPAS
jgi:hypothetical protein